MYKYEGRRYIFPYAQTKTTQRVEITGGHARSQFELESIHLEQKKQKKNRPLKTGRNVNF